jgi:hypothetical protein
MPTANEILEGVREEVKASGRAKTASADIDLSQISDSHFEEIANRFGQQSEKRAAVSKLVAEGQALDKGQTTAGTFLKKAHKLAWQEALKRVGFKPGMTPLHLVDPNPARHIAMMGAKFANDSLSLALEAGLDPAGFLERRMEGVQRDDE